MPGGDPVAAVEGEGGTEPLAERHALVIAEHFAQLGTAELIANRTIQTFADVKSYLSSPRLSIGDFPADAGELIFDKIFDVPLESVIREHGAHLAGEHLGARLGSLFRFIAHEAQRGRRFVAEGKKRFIIGDDRIDERAELPLERRALLVVGSDGEFRIQLGRAQKYLSALLFAERFEHVLFQKIQLRVVVVHGRFVPLLPFPLLVAIIINQNGALCQYFRKNFAKTIDKP